MISWASLRSEYGHNESVKEEDDDEEKKIVGVLQWPNQLDDSMDTLSGLLTSGFVFMLAKALC